jgi:FkbM family methyltransferase
MEQKPAQRDIISFLRRHEYDLILGREKYYPPLRTRLIALRGLFEGVFTVRDWWSLTFVTGHGRSQTLRDAFDAYVNTKTKERLGPIANHDGSFDLSGKKFFCPSENWHELLDVLHEVFMLDQYQVRRFFEKDTIAIDAGANLGSFSVFAAQNAPEGNVYAFEPVSKTFGIAEKNVEPYPNIECFHVGLGDKETEKNIVTSPVAMLGSAFEDSGMPQAAQGDRGAGLERAMITTIDAFVLARRIPRIDFIKIDTEGYEANILNGARQTIKKWRPVVAMSAYHHPQDKTELPSLIKDIDSTYRHELVTGSDEVFVFYHAEPIRMSRGLIG